MNRYEQTRQTLKLHGLAPKKRFGQNFLVHRSTAEAIVRAGGLDEKDRIIEVGVGLGALTVPLAKQVESVIGLEVDSGIIRFHEQEQDLPENVSLLHQDILKADFNKLNKLAGPGLKIMANLPYSISNPFIFKLIENRESMDWATVMLQKEVAQRLQATPSSKQYGIPTVLLGVCATVQTLMTLKPAEFHPRPKVDSVVVKIDFTQNRVPAVHPEDYDRTLFTTLVRAAFSQRRKTLLNNLSQKSLLKDSSGADKATLKKMSRQFIEQAGLSPGERAENIDLTGFIRLTRAFSSQQ